jgi:hypothetical protein
LSPKSLFFGLVVVGLPFAIVTGWALGAPVITPGALGTASEPNGVGGLGAAPATSVPDQGSAGGYTAHPPRATTAPGSSAPATATSAGPAVTMTVTVTTSVPPPLVVTSSPPPLLTNPPVPTPTHIVDDPDPSDTPPAIPSETPSPSVSPSGS